MKSFWRATQKRLNLITRNWKSKGQLQGEQRRPDPINDFWKENRKIKGKGKFLQGDPEEAALEVQELPMGTSSRKLLKGDTGKSRPNSFWRTMGKVLYPPVSLGDSEEAGPKENFM